MENYINGNICCFCAYSVGAHRWGMGLVNCPVVGLANCRESKCPHYREKSDCGTS